MILQNTRRRRREAFDIRRISKHKRDISAADTVTLASWTTTNLTPDQIVHQYLRTTRARSRELVDNNDVAASYVRLCTNHIVGHNGFAFKAKARNENKTLDNKANDAIGEAWKEFNCEGYVEYRHKHDGAGLDRLIVRTVAVDGEVFVQDMAAPRDEHGITYRVHDPETVPLDYNEDGLPGGQYIRFGIRYDAEDRPLGYYFRSRAGLYAYHSGYTGQKESLTYVTADKITHIYIEDRPGLRRGFPWMTPAMVRARLIGQFEDAAMKNALVGASKVGILSGLGADDIGDTDDGEAYTGAVGGLIDTEHVEIYQTDQDVDFNTFDTQFPSNEYGEFVKVNMMFLSAGLGVNYNTLTGDLSGVNYSSLKHGTTEERETWKALQSWFIFDWKTPQFRKWLSIKLLIGINITPARQLRVQDYERYRKHEFNGRRWVGTDPAKDATAHEKDLNNRLKSPQAIIREGGGDPETVLDELAEWQKQLEKRNIKAVAPPTTAEKPPIIDEDNENAEENDENDED